MNKKALGADKILWYFASEKKTLALITVSGLMYNFGLAAGPWFEGKLVLCLSDVFGGSKAFADMAYLVVAYAITMAIIQIARYVKRFYVRRFANNVNSRMKKILYSNLVIKDKIKLSCEGEGDIITKAVSDVDDCAEGMRKFTTEVFDTGITLLAYTCMLMVYDLRLALMCLVFPTVSYFLAEKMKYVVQRTRAIYKAESGNLGSATLDRVTNALTYRIYGCEKQREGDYEAYLTSYEKAAVKSDIWVSALPSLYKILTMSSVLFIIYFGSKNVLGSGWSPWDIAAFTTFFSCYTKLALKTSKSAKLFNSVHKAQVSWKRIKPLLVNAEDRDEIKEDIQAKSIDIENLSFAYPGEKEVFENITLHTKPGEIIGITGAVACGKSTFGKVFLCEYPYTGSIRVGGEELSEMSDALRCKSVGYLGHDPELQNESIKNNIAMGEDLGIDEYLKAVCLDGEVAEMPDGIETKVGSGGVRLSGGQAARLALARTLYHKRPILVLDDPFSALDRSTEKKVFENLKKISADSTVFLISHRLWLFPKFDKIMWMKDGKTVVGTHDELMKSVPEYAKLYKVQEKKKSDEE